MSKKSRLARPKQTQKSGHVAVAESSAMDVIDYPIFCFKHIHSTHDIDSCSADDKNALLKRLVKLSSMTWDQIKFADRHGLGFEKIDVGSIRPNLPNFLSGDVKHLLAFRFSGLKPFLGHRSGPILHVLFIDDDFDVYNHSS